VRDQLTDVLHYRAAHEYFEAGVVFVILYFLIALSMLYYYMSIFLISLFESNTLHPSLTWVTINMKAKIIPHKKWATMNNKNPF